MAVKKGTILPDTISFLRLGDSDDVGYGLQGDDKLYGGHGNDRLYGQDGNDLLVGGFGRDRIQGGEHSDKIYGDDGNDILLGQAGNDALFGGAGRDRLEGGSSNGYLDTLEGGRGADTLIGGEGFDWMSGGAGADRFIFNPGDSLDAKRAPEEADIIVDFSDADAILLVGVDRSDVTIEGRGPGQYLVNYRTGPGADDIESIRIKGDDPTGDILFV